MSNKKHKPRSNPSIKGAVAVIGGGVAGLAIAARLASSGYGVTLFESAPEAGGKLTDERIDGFRFDNGPSLFTMPELLEALFEECGKDLSDYLEYHALDLVTRYFYPEGTRLDAWSDPKRFALELEEQLGEPASRVERYLKRARLMYETTSPVFLFKSLNDWSNLLRFSTFLKVLKLPWLGAHTSMHQFNKKWFKHNRTVQLFDRFATYNGSDPYRAPATLNLISYIEHGKGAFYPKGGMIAIRDALVKLNLELGVQFRFNTKVDRFFIHQRKIKGLTIGKEREVFNKVVSAVDITQVNQHMYPRNARFARKRPQELSTSALIFHWGMKGDFQELDLHNIFFSSNYHREFQYLRRGKIANDPTIYVYVSSKLNAADAPQAHENWFVMVNTPPHKDQNWEEYVAAVRTYALKHLGEVLKRDLAPLLVCETITTPEDLERKTGSVGGAIYGPASNSKWSAFLRQSNKHAKIEGLYFVGGSVHPGGGIPLCLLSAAITADLISG
ncbi:MAG: phytoene desaturase family protein [Bacteroidia bacterium]